MKKLFFLAALFLSALAAQAQEKVINVQKTDGTTTQTRVADLKQINFLTVEQGGKGLIVTTTGGDAAGVLFEANPVVTIAEGKITITRDADDALVYELTDIAEIRFGDATAASIETVKGFEFVIQESGAVLRGIPENVQPRLYTIDGRNIPAPHVSAGELRLSRETLGTGIYILKVGTFATKIKL